MDLEHKIDMLIKKRSSKLNIGIWSLVFLLLFGTPFSWLFGYIPTHNTTLGCLFVSLFLVFVFMFYHMSDKNIINTIKKTNDQFTIVNSIFYGTQNGGFVFGNNGDFLVKREFSKNMEDLYVEETLQVGYNYCILYSQFSNSPIAIFRGHYNGNKYGKTFV